VSKNNFVSDIIKINLKEKKKMNQEMLKEIMSNIDLVKELDEYGKNKLAVLIKGLLIEIIRYSTV